MLYIKMDIVITNRWFVTMVKCTNAGGRTKGANEKAIVLVHQHGRDDIT